MTSSPRLHTKVFHNGYHPIFTTTLSNWSSECSHHLLFKLPPMAFVDPYELETSYADQYAFHLIGHQGLEPPVMAIEQGDSHVLLDISNPSSEGRLEIPLPVHLRYGQLSSTDAYEDVEIPWPKGFLVCDDSKHLSAHDSQVHIPKGFQHLFNRRSIIQMEPVEGESPVEVLRVPVGNLSHLEHVEIGTAFTILACFIYLCWTGYRTKLRIDKPDSRKVQ